MLEYIFFSTINSLLYGMLLFMLSSGLTLIFSMMGILSFAHASFFMLGAYFAYQISRFVGFWPALVFAPLLVGILGALVERYGLRSVHKHGHVAELLFTVGLAYLIEEGVMLIWGRNAVPYRIPNIMDFPLINIFGTDLSAYRVFMLVVAALLFTAMLFIDAVLPHEMWLRLSLEDLCKLWACVFFGLYAWEILLVELPELQCTTAMATSDNNLLKKRK